MRGTPALIPIVLAVVLLPLWLIGCKGADDTVAEVDPAAADAEAEHDHDHGDEAETPQEPLDPGAAQAPPGTADRINELLASSDEADIKEGVSLASMLKSPTERANVRDSMRSLIVDQTISPESRAGAISFWATWMADEPDPVMAAAGSNSPVVRKAVAAVLGHAKSPRARELLAELKEDPDTSVSAVAAEALATMLAGTKSDSAIDTLIADLGRPEGDRSAQAAMKLEQRGRADRVVVDRAMEALRTDPHPAARASCATVLGMTCAGSSPGQERYSGRLTTIYRADRNPEPAYDKPVPVLMERLINDPSPTVRAACAEALGCIGSERAAPALAKALKDPDQYVRRRAASALIVVPPDDVIEDVIQAARFDESAAVRRFAVEALATQTTREAELAVSFCLSDGDADVRIYAAETLGRIGTRLTLSALTDLFDDPNEDVRWKAVSAAAQIADPKDPEIRKAFIASLWDPSARVALAAERGLHLLGVARNAPTRDEREMRRRMEEAVKARGDGSDESGPEVPDASDEPTDEDGEQPGEGD